MHKKLAIALGVACFVWLSVRRSSDSNGKRANKASCSAANGLLRDADNDSRDGGPRVLIVVHRDPDIPAHVEAADSQVVGLYSKLMRSLSSGEALGDNHVGSDRLGPLEVNFVLECSSNDLVQVDVDKSNETRQSSGQRVVSHAATVPITVAGPHVTRVAAIKQHCELKNDAGGSWCLFVTARRGVVPYAGWLGALHQALVAAELRGGVVVTEPPHVRSIFSPPATALCPLDNGTRQHLYGARSTTGHVPGHVLPAGWVHADHVMYMSSAVARELFHADFLAPLVPGQGGGCNGVNDAFLVTTRAFALQLAAFTLDSVAFFVDGSLESLHPKQPPPLERSEVRGKSTSLGQDEQAMLAFLDQIVSATLDPGLLDGAQKRRGGKEEEEEENGRPLLLPRYVRAIQARAVRAPAQWLQFAGVEWSLSDGPLPRDGSGRSLTSDPLVGLLPCDTDADIRLRLTPLERAARTI